MTDAVVCEELGVSIRQLRRWKDAVKEHGEEDAFPGHGKARDTEVARLRRQLRRIVGWAMDRAVGRHLVCEALTMALGYRQPDGAVVHHSDRGPQYTSDDFRDICRDNNIECSMSARGSCYDNAVVERFYNRKRTHSYLGYLSPVQYEKQAVGT